MTRATPLSVPVYVEDDGAEPELVAVARRYLAAIEARDGSVLGFYAPDAVQVELPNRLVQDGITRDLSALKEAGERGLKVISRERYEVRNAIAMGNRVALEVAWTGTLAVPMGALKAGYDMKAHFAFFLDFRDGKIVRQRNYDCFEPF